MKTLLKQKGSKHNSREEVMDALAGIQAGQGCVFAYADFTEMRAIGFFEMNCTHSSTPTPESLIEGIERPLKWKGQDWVVVNDDGKSDPNEEDHLHVKLQ